MMIAAPLHAQASPSEQPVQQADDNLAFEEDDTERMTVPVTIGSRGPYRFLVDTGAERTVISQELARQLGLRPGAHARLHSMSEVSEVGTVVIPRLNVSARAFKDINAPALSRRNLGAEGMLGVDSLKSQRVLFDFHRQTMSISPSHLSRRRADDDAIVVTARSRFGRLILADARAEGQKLWVVIDTGSQVTIGNQALRDRLERKGRLGPTTPIDLISVTGGAIVADYTQIGGVTIGGVKVRNMPVAFADVHPFRKLRLTSQPALLLGMDVLRMFDQVSIDFASREVRFVMPGLSDRAPATQMAALAR